MNKQLLEHTDLPQDCIGLILKYIYGENILKSIYGDIIYWKTRFNECMRQMVYSTWYNHNKKDTFDLWRFGVLNRVDIDVSTQSLPCYYTFFNYDYIKSRLIRYHL